MYSLSKCPTNQLIQQETAVEYPIEFLELYHNRRLSESRLLNALHPAVQISILVPFARQLTLAKEFRHK